MTQKEEETSEVAITVIIRVQNIRHDTGLADNGELSIRIYDDNLKQNIDADSEYEPEPCEPDHPYFYEH